MTDSWTAAPTPAVRPPQSEADAPAQAVAPGKVGFFEWDRATDELRHSPGFCGLLGWGDEPTPETGRACLARLAPGDRGRVEELRGGLTPTSPTYSLRYRVTDPEGHKATVEERGCGFFDNEGRLVRIIGTLADVSAEGQAEEALRRERSFLRTVIDATPSMVFVKDLEGRFVLANEALARCYGSTVNGVVGRSDAEFNPDAEEVARFRRDDCEVMRSRGNKLIPEEKVTCADGETRWFSTIKVALIGPDGECDKVLGVAVDITDRRQAEDALREADRRKDEFLAMLAHELRNPLAPIRNAVHVMGLLDQGEPRLRWARELIERQVAHLSRLVDDLLDVSRIVRGKVVLKKAPVDLATVVNHALEAAQPLVQSKGHTLAVRLPDGPVRLDADPVRLSQVLVNLLDNAVKYTPDGGRIEVEGRVAGQEVVLSVRDNGMGIPAPLVPRVFDLFQQGARTLDRAHGGLGIGLTLVRRLVEMHGGRVSARSPGPGQGSTFLVWLPLPGDAAASSPPDARAQGLPAAGMRVLVVDDDPAVTDSTAVWLQLEGHEVRIAHSGQSALEQALEFRPRVVLLDIGLSGMDGYETARRLRRQPGGRDLCLLAVTGYSHEEARARVREAEFDHHLVKPVDPHELAALLAALRGPTERPVTAS